MNLSERQNPPHPLLPRVPLLSWIPLAAILLAAAPGRLDAGAWTQSQGGSYFKMAGLFFSSQEYLNTDGERQDRVEAPSTEKLSDQGLSAYLEYGLRDHLTLVASLPYKRLVFEKTDVRVFKSDLVDTTIIREHPDETSSGLADLELRLRWRLLLDPAVVSLAAGGKFPMGYKIAQDSFVPLGTGERDGEVRLLVGKSLYPLPAYVTGTLGYRRRGGDFGDELFHGLEAGYSYNRLLVKGVVEGIQTLGDCGAMGEGGGLIGDQNSLKLSPGLIWSFNDRLEISADLFHIASGCNTAAGTTYALGLAFKG